MKLEQVRFEAADHPREKGEGQEAWVVRVAGETGINASRVSGGVKGPSFASAADDFPSQDPHEGPVSAYVVVDDGDAN